MTTRKIPSIRRIVKSALPKSHRAAQWLLLLGLLASATLFQPGSAPAANKLARLITNGAYLVDDGTGTRQYRARDSFIPASTIKVLTSLAAVETLGLDYRFETHFFLDADHNLYIKGYGDPFLTSETILDIGGQLYGLGVRRIDNIYLDESAFALEGPTSGSENSANSYDAPNGALAVNFNALPIQVGKDGRIVSGEQQTPPLPLMQEIGPRLTAGSHRVNLAAFPCIPNISPTLRYTGELFSAQLQQAGIAVNSCFEAKPVPQHLTPLLVYRNNLTLAEVVRACLKGSNNFIANQLFLACGAKAAGLPATWKKSQDFFEDYIRNVLSIPQSELRMVEGSGLSRQNRITARALVQVLHRFSPHADLLTPKEGVLLKTGTMRNIFCYAGYLEEENRMVPFAILLNQEKNTRKDILQLLQHGTVKTAALPPKEKSTDGRPQ